MHLSTLSTVAALVASASLSAQITGGSFTTSGDGCPAPGAGGAVYEQFIAAAGDLDGTGLTYTNNGDGYAVAAGGTFYAAFGGTQLTVGDDSVVQQPLPFGFAVPGFGVLNTLSIDSNGRVGSFTSSDFSESVGELLGDSELTIAVNWDDLSPNVSGGLYVDEITGNPAGMNYVVVTYDQVPQFANSDSNTFQVQLWDNGDIHMLWNGGNANDHIVGISTGGGLADPGPTDLSAAVPFNLTGFGNSYTLALGQTPGSGDVNIGNGSFSLDVAGIAPGSTVGAMNLGFSTASIDLAVIGAPGCFAYTSGDIAFPLGVGGLTSSFGVPIPNDPALVGNSLYTQAVVATPGINALGAATSNRGDLNIGTVGEVVIECVGSNSYNSNTANGYFRVTNNSGLDITAVNFDFNTTGLEFDTDQTGMADRFDGGDGTSGTAGCQNTYRNSCDVTTGLVYAGTAASPCSGDPVGWTGVTPGTPTNDWISIDFNFTDFNSGERFEFDADTDGGPGIGGDDMAGTTVTVTLADGRVLTGTITAGGSDYGRADM